MSAVSEKTVRLVDQVSATLERIKKAYDAGDLSQKDFIDQLENLEGELKQVSGGMGKFDKSLKENRESSKKASKALQGVESELKDVQKQTTKTGSEFDQLNKLAGKLNLASKFAMAYQAIQQVVQISGELVNQYTDQVQAETRLQIALENTGQAAEGVYDSIISKADEMQDTTGIRNREYIQQMSRMVNSGMAVAEAERVVAMSMDVSAATGQDLETVMDQIRDARTGSLTAMEDYLSREKALQLEQKKEAENWTQAEWEAAVYIATLEGLEKRYAGQAEAMSEQRGGIDQLQAAWEDLKETLGSAILPIITKITEFITPLIEQIDRLFASFSADMDTSFFDNILVVFDDVWNIVQGLIESIWGALQSLNKSFDSLGLYDLFASAWEVVKELFRTVENLIDGVAVLWDNAAEGEGILSVIYDLMSGIYKLLEWFLDLVGGILSGLNDGLEWIIEAFADLEINLKKIDGEINTISKSIEDQREKLMDLSNIEVETDVVLGTLNADADVYAELEGIINETAKSFPELAQRMEAVARSSDNLETKQKKLKAIFGEVKESQKKLISKK